MRKECQRWHISCENKSMSFAMVCSEVNLVEEPRNTWWLDSDVSANISVFVQTKLNELGAYKTTRVLELIHTNICGPFPTSFWSGVVPKYIVPGSPNINGIFGRHNHTLKDMVRSMIALKTAAYIVNKYELKQLLRHFMSFGLERKSSLMHFHIWGCPAEARPYRSFEKKLNSRTMSSYFVSYSPTSKTIFETGTITFFEDINFRGEIKLRTSSPRENRKKINEATPLQNQR
ncbi:hypothetical protein EUTSA_v10000719mg [Eutrema salsugineum]|uniref:Integrase catalytic domain-containing protein n=1 Tax=Eutrema salsugineum TaxID=72664 RepID=V4LW14_EUTSA|nr:hypothetical protein EUTSA_v10000719mg [Eutrema salsugineum]